MRDGAHFSKQQDIPAFKPSLEPSRFYNSPGKPLTTDTTTALHSPRNTGVYMRSFLRSITLLAATIATTSASTAFSQSFPPGITPVAGAVVSETVSSRAPSACSPSPPFELCGNSDRKSSRQGSQAGRLPTSHPPGQSSSEKAQCAASGRQGSPWQPKRLPPQE